MEEPKKDYYKTPIANEGLNRFWKDLHLWYAQRYIYRKCLIAICVPLVFVGAAWKCIPNLDKWTINV